MQRMGVVVLLELTAGDDDVVTAFEVQSSLLVVGDEAVVDAGVFVTVIEEDAVATMFADRQAVQENLVHP